MENFPVGCLNSLLPCPTKTAAGKFFLQGKIFPLNWRNSLHVSSKASSRTDTFGRISPYLLSVTFPGGLFSALFFYFKLSTILSSHLTPNNWTSPFSGSYSGDPGLLFQAEDELSWAGRVLNFSFALSSRSSFSVFWEWKQVSITWVSSTKNFQASESPV